MKEAGSEQYTFTDSNFAKILIRVILLITVSLLIVELTQAQAVFTLSANGNKTSGLKNKTSVVPASKTSLVSDVPPKTDSISAGPAVKMRNLDRIPGSVNKADAMVNSYFRGVYDADSNYKAKKTGKGLIFVTTLITGPVGGLIPAIACSSMPPKNNLNIPNSPWVSNESYMKGYKSEAHYIKKHNTWPCYIIASIIWIAAANLVLR